MLSLKEGESSLSEGRLIKWQQVSEEDRLVDGSEGVWWKVNGIPSAIELSAYTNKKKACMFCSPKINYEHFHSNILKVK